MTTSQGGSSETLQPKTAEELEAELLEAHAAVGRLLALALKLGATRDDLAAALTEND